jgi:hypothetical protein
MKSRWPRLVFAWICNVVMSRCDMHARRCGAEPALAPAFASTMRSVGAAVKSTTAQANKQAHIWFLLCVNTSKQGKRAETPSLAALNSMASMAEVKATARPEVLAPKEDLEGPARLPFLMLRIYPAAFS